MFNYYYYYYYAHSYLIGVVYNILIIVECVSTTRVG